MKVKVSELKTHLSSYLKNIEEAGEIEVCLREEPVAYLVPVGAKGQMGEKLLAEKVCVVGLILQRSAGGMGAGVSHTATRPAFVPVPEVAGDGRTDISTVQSMREERAY
ncbi:MAG: hypothetical protein EA353_03025 [Puniceicoccaceae bacterium]|nr:MAG: hypothetical protein EA353_03025 [Puniceicoccaceae bacterium]